MRSPSRKFCQSRADENREGGAISTTIVRGKYVIARALDRHRWEQIDDGAVLQQDGVITAIGAFSDLHRDNPGAPVVGDGQQVL